MIRNPFLRRLIVLEGIDGVGKTTTSRLLTDALNRLEPGSAVRFEELEYANPTIPLKRVCVSEQIVNVASYLTYMLSAVYKDRKVRELLAGSHVVADRYIYTVLAHHEAHGIDTSVIDLSRLPILEPDFVFHLVADEEVRRSRLSDRGNLNRADQRVKTPGSELELIDQVFARHIPCRIDTTSLSVDGVVDRILSTLH